MPANKPIATLQDIAKKYDQNLARKTITYNVRHKGTPFRLKFDEGHLAHLLALHYFGYKRGEKLYPLLLDGKITWDTLERKNEGAFKQHEFRMLYFLYATEILQIPKISVFDQQAHGSGIDAEFMFYNEQSKRFLSLGVKKENSPSQFFIPVTFQESKHNKWSKTTHVLLSK